MPGFVLHVAPRGQCEPIEPTHDMTAQYQFVADVSIHCCDETGNLAGRGSKRDATDLDSHASMTLGPSL